jgi:Spy/CpxP family protein refolding chaperone
MRRLSIALALVGAFLAGGLLMNGMITRADDKTEPKVRGTLYPNWKKLGLTDEQTQKIYKIRATYEAQVQDLQKQIRDLRKKELAEAETVLTPAQKERLRELRLGDGDKDKPIKDKPIKDKPLEKDKSPEKDK